MKRSLHGELKYIFCFLLILLCCILLCSCSAVHEASKARVIERYLDNSVVFDQIVQDIPYQHSGLFRVFMHGSIVVPQEILDLGVKEIYYGPDGIFFEFSHVVFFVPPQGILYSENVKGIGDWYKLESIRDNWYYFWIFT